MVEYEVATSMAESASDTGANTSGINMTASCSNITSPNTGANTSGAGVKTTTSIVRLSVSTE
jgi:hypothetical protein